MRPRLLASLLLAAPVWAAEYALEARDTVSGFEMDRGDVVRFKLRNGQVRTLVLEETSARILLSNLREPRKAQPTEERCMRSARACASTGTR